MSTSPLIEEDVLRVSLVPVNAFTRSIDEIIFFVGYFHRAASMNRMNITTQPIVT